MFCPGFCIVRPFCAAASMLHPSNTASPSNSACARPGQCRRRPARRRRHRPPSLPATARKPPTAWTTPSSGPWKSGSATCATWKTGAAILASIEEQGKLTAELQGEISDAETKQRLEDLYLPLQAKTSHQGPDRPGGRPRTLAWPRGRPHPGARGRSGKIPQRRRRLCRRQGRARWRPPDPHGTICRGRHPARRPAGLPQRPRRGEIGGDRRQEAEGAKFRDWFDFAEPSPHACPRTAPWPCCAAVTKAYWGFPRSRLGNRGSPGKAGPNPANNASPAFRHQDQGRPADKWLADTVRWTWKVKIYTHLELELMNRCGGARKKAIRVFGRNLAICYSPLRPASASPWASTRASAPAARSPSWTPPASSSTPPPSTPTTALRLGRLLAPSPPGARHGVPWWPSATARPAGKPTPGWWPT